MVQINIKSDAYGKFYSGSPDNLGVITVAAGFGLIFSMFFLSDMTSDQGFIVIGIGTCILAMAFSMGNTFLLKAYYMIKNSIVDI